MYDRLYVWMWMLVLCSQDRVRLGEKLGYCMWSISVDRFGLGRVVLLFMVLLAGLLLLLLLPSAPALVEFFVRIYALVRKLKEKVEYVSLFVNIFIYAICFSTF